MNKKRKTIANILLFTMILSLLSTALLSCSGGGLYSEGNGELKVVCSSFPPFDLAKQIGGNKVTLTILQDNGADLHNYSPTAKTLAALNEADIFICVGGESDKKWVDDAISSAQNPDLKVLRMTDFVELRHAELESHNHGDADHSEEHDHESDGDEHVWLSLKNTVKITDGILSAFCEKDGENESYYKAQAESFKSVLAALDNEYAEAVSSAKNKTLVVADRFPFVYLTNDYGLCYYAAFSGCSTEVNADFATQIKLINAVKEHSLPAVIVTEGGNKELADNICAETGCKKAVLNSMQSITRAEIENGASYLEIMKSNLAALKEALG